MRSFHLFILVAAALAWSPCAFANDAPPPAGAPAAQQPAPPAPPPPSDPQPPAPKAARRDEEEAEKERAGLMARLRAHLKGTGAMADEVATLQAENARLQARVKELENGTELAALRKENEAMKADITEFLNHAQTHGMAPVPKTGPPAAAPQSPMGKAATAAVAGGVSTQLAALGVPAATLPPSAPAAGAPAATIEQVEELLKAATTAQEKQDILTKHRALILKSN